MQRSQTIRLVIAAVGFAPVTALAASVVGDAELYTTAAVLVLPCLAALAELMWLKPSYRTIVLSGFIFGLVAVTIYDLFRLPFILTGIWPDFIPKIGMWLINDGKPHPIVGYLYRYIGDGGGMGMAFVALYPFLRRLSANSFVCGIVYGIGIWAGLIATVLIAHHGQEYLFRITALSLTLSLAGHLIYGGVLGLLIGNERARHLLRVETEWQPAALEPAAD